MKMNCCSDCPCVDYAECCHFPDGGMPEKEELSIKKELFKKTGTLYLYPFSKLTINITPKENEILKKEAKKLGIKVKFLPKKIFITKDNIVIYDYFIDSPSRICPFLKDNKCQIYPNRPEICRQFPNIKHDNTQFKQFQANNLIIKENYEKCLEYVKEKIE